MSFAAIAIGTAVVGTGASLYGANKQSKAQSASDAANRAAIAESDRNAWNSYLMQRGMNTGGMAATGAIPSSGTTAVNTKLPLWANVRTNQLPAGQAAAGKKPFLIKK